jgi:hypothetical protein
MELGKSLTCLEETVNSSCSKSGWSSPGTSSFFSKIQINIILPYNPRLTLIVCL